MQSHLCGAKENGCTDFQSWKKSQKEKERKVSWEQQLTGCCQDLWDHKEYKKMWDKSKSALWCVCLQWTLRVTATQFHGLKFNPWHSLVTDRSILLLSWLTDVLSKGAMSHLVMPRSTKLHNLWEQRTWEAKMLPLLSIKSLTKLLLARAISLGCSIHYLLVAAFL